MFGGGVLHTVSMYKIHPEYNRGTLNNDVAIAKVAVNFGGYNQKPIALPDIGEELEGGMKAIVSGWGRMSDGDSPIILNKVTVPIMNRTDCNALWGGVTDAYV